MTCTSAALCCPVASLVMDKREHILRQQIITVGEGSSEHAALLTELAGLSLAQGKMEEANTMLQQVYAMRMKEFVTGMPGMQEQEQQHGSTCAAELLSAQTPAGGIVSSSQAPAPAPGLEAPLTAAPLSSSITDSSNSTSQAGSQSAPHQQQQRLEASDADWDKSDDWEPNLAVLQTASSFDRSTGFDKQSGMTPVGSGVVNSQQQASSGLTSRTAARPSDAASWRRPQPRGRGDSKCGEESGSDSEWDTQGSVNDMPHIVEIHGLNRSVKTSNLDDFLLEFAWGGTAPNVRWVDDEHALAVFPCAEAARALLNAQQPKYKVRPYSKASRAALELTGEDLLPPRANRPKTTTAVARRLISNALGNREVRDKTAEKELADLRKANKQGKQQRQQELDAAWGTDD